MKRLSLLSLVLLLAGQMAFSQTSIVQINPYVGYSTASALNMYYGKVRTTGNVNYGGNLSFGKGMSGGGFTRNAFVELQYNYLKTDLEYRFYDVGAQNVPAGEISMHNIMIGGTKESGNEKVVGYGGSYLGVTIFDPSRSEFNSYTRFTLAFGLGLKYAISPRVGLRLHTQMYLPFWGSDFYIGWSPGGGTSAGIASSYINVYGTFNGGLYFNLGGGE
jgi:hypothetical protein